MADTTTLRLPAGLMREAKAYADGLGLSVNALCAVALGEYLDKRTARPADPPEAVPTSRGGDGVSLSAPVAKPAIVVPASAAPSKPVTVAAAWKLPAGGVNAPCSCGSGQKWKKCHGLSEFR